MGNTSFYRTIPQRGFSLVELMIVLAIIGILVAILIPNLIDAKNRARQKASSVELRNIALGISAYMAERGIVPPTITAGGVTVATFHSDIVPYALSAIHDRDGWNQDMYAFSSDAVSYTVVSYGRDGSPGPCITLATFRNWDEDTIITDGIFICSPS